jgi:DNA mismatch endonuclease (patch repair protein)
MERSQPVAMALTAAERRSLLMARVRRAGTGPEVALRKALHRRGFRYRLRTGSGLPGTPDIVLPRFRLAIFVDGCFWHGCKTHGTLPKTNALFWETKITRNRERDRRADRSLRGQGWTVVRVWEHEINIDVEGVAAGIASVTNHAGQEPMTAH